MKPSKYSKRRPSSGLVIMEKDVGKPIKSGAIVTPRKHVTPAHLLNNYDVVIFLDDVRNPMEINLPKGKHTLIPRNFLEFRRVIKYVLNDNEITSLFVSFDHYLDHIPNHYHTGTQCLLELIFQAKQLKTSKRIDISGHSSDHSMNAGKARIYALEGEGIGYYFNMGRG